MKKLFDDELTLDDLKKMILKSRNKMQNRTVIFLSVLGIITMIIGIVYAVLKLRGCDQCDCGCEDDDFYIDDEDDDDYYADDEDFE